MNKVDQKQQKMSYVQNNVGDQSQPFQQINEILDDQFQGNSSNSKQTLILKINELQKICISLTDANRRLIERIEQLQEQSSCKNNASHQTTFNEEYSQMQCDFNDIEDIIKEYRTDLHKYQTKMALLQADNITKLAEIQDNCSYLQNQLESAKTRIFQLERENQALQQTKESLLVELDQYDLTARQNKQENKQNYKRNHQYAQSSYDNEESTDFNNTVQVELQKLIQKLIKELEHERGQKKKLSEQIKLLQNDILSLEREITKKNNKIYSLEINALKNGKNNQINATLKNSVTTRIPTNARQVEGDNRAGQTDTGNRARQFDTGNRARQVETGNRARQVETSNRQNRKSSKSQRSFSLMEVMNECVELSSQQKLFISSRIIELYLKKVQNKDYSSQILQSLIVTNYTPSNPDLVAVKINKSIQRQIQAQYDQTQTEVIWNLAFVLDNLFNQSSDRNSDFGSSQTENCLLQVITHLLENRQDNEIEGVLQLRRLVEQSISVRIG